MQASPFAASSGITSADIDKIQARLDTMEKNIMDKIDAFTKKSSPPITEQAAPTVAPLSGLSQVLPPVPTSPVDLASIFPKEGGGRRSKRSKKTRRHRKK